MKKKNSISLHIAAAAMMISPSLHAGESPKHVVELFTSQSCYSCPPAEELLGEIVADHAEILALEFHVDYWNSLVYGSAGQWQDPFSSEAFSLRQRAYRQFDLDGRTGVYTPQMIVDGRYAFVGSRKNTALQQIEMDSNLVLDVAAEITSDGVVRIDLSGDYGDDADVWLITYDVKQVTEIPSGENKGKTLENYNIVRSMESVGQWTGMKTSISAEGVAINENQGCAVVVQKYDHRYDIVGGPIVGAANCVAS